MKAQILSHLSQSATPVSGENLSQILGVSRVAVWKHIHQLQAHGYEIEAGAKGYRLICAPDTPFPWFFGHRASRIHYFPHVESTMDAARELARQGCPDLTVVVADRQTKGRGRLQRQWQSDFGGLYFTMVLRPAITPVESALINLAAAVDMSEAIHSLYDVDVWVKWPNDLLVNGRKLSGILSQMAAESDRIEFVNLGIGVNVHNDTQDVQPPAISLSKLIDRQVSRVEILAEFCERFENRMVTNNLESVIPQWKTRTITLGKQVRVQTLNECVEGRAVDIEKNGGLVLETSSGEYKTVLYGDCFHRDI